jgi:hypothetical protein
MNSFGMTPTLLAGAVLALIAIFLVIPIPARQSQYPIKQAELAQP